LVASVSGSIRRTESHFESGGRTLFRRGWLAPEPGRLLVLVHGFAEHSGRYEHVGRWFATRGFAVHAYDQQGHGRSEGNRGHVDRFDDMLDDLEAFLERVRREHPGLPPFVVGHSMGGLEVAAWVSGRRPDIAGAVTSGAALEVAEVPSPAQRFALRVMRRLRPKARLDRPIATEALSRDPAVGRAYREDPLVFQYMTLSLAAAFYAAGRSALENARRTEVPMLLLHGEDDPLTPARGSRAFFEQLDPSRSELRIYPGLRHEIFNEPEQEQVFSDLLAWIEKRPEAA
jgi:alpha-beta hydrolase superfamily lysophospholipase